MPIFLHSFSAAMLVSLGVTKIFSGQSLFTSPWGKAAFVAEIIEVLLGLLIFRWKSKRTLQAALVFSLCLLAFSVLGPDLPVCFCLGTFGRMTSTGRTLLSLFMVALFSETIRLRQSVVLNK